MQLMPAPPFSSASPPYHRAWLASSSADPPSFPIAHPTQSSPALRSLPLST